MKKSKQKRVIFYYLFLLASFCCYRVMNFVFYDMLVINNTSFLKLFRLNNSEALFVAYTGFQKLFNVYFSLPLTIFTVPIIVC